MLFDRCRHHHHHCGLMFSLYHQDGMFCVCMLLLLLLQLVPKHIVLTCQEKQDLLTK